MEQALITETKNQKNQNGPLKVFWVQPQFEKFK